MNYVKLSNIYLVKTQGKGFQLCINSQTHPLMGCQNFTITQPDDKGLCKIKCIGEWVSGIYLSLADLLLRNAKTFEDTQVHESYIDADVLYLWKSMVKSNDIQHLLTRLSTRGELAPEEKEVIKVNLKDQFIRGLFRGHSSLTEVAYKEVANNADDNVKEI